MNPTRAATLLAIVFVVGTLMWLVLHSAYTSMPPLPWTAAATLGLLALAELVSALNVRARMLRGRGVRAMNPLVVARFAVFAKASAYTAAVASGAFAGIFAYVLPDLARGVGHHDAWVSGGTFGAALLLCGAALFLEYTCRVPDPPEGSQNR